MVAIPWRERDLMWIYIKGYSGIHEGFRLRDASFKGDRERLLHRSRQDPSCMGDYMRRITPKRITNKFYRFCRSTTLVFVFGQLNTHAHTYIPPTHTYTHTHKHGDMYNCWARII